MQKLHRDVLNIIKRSLTGTGAPPEDLDYDGIFQMGKAHQMIPLIFHGLYSAEMPVKDKEKFKNTTANCLYQDQNQLYALSEMQTAFSEKQIDYMLLKGASIKRIYPFSEMRMMGDIDILIKEEQYPQIRQIMSDLGFEEQIESDHEFVWHKEPKIHVELHKKLIPSYNDDYYAYYQNAWEKAKASIEKPCVFSMSNEDEYLYVFTHLTKHYRDGGIGIKHVVDMWLYDQKYPDMDKAYIYQELDKLQLRVFYENIWKTIRVWFENGETDDVCEHITTRIIESGAYGLAEMRSIAQAARESARETSVGKARRKKIWTSIFLPYRYMKIKYPVLQKVPVLLPVMWVVRWFQAIFFKRKNIKAQAKNIQRVNSETVGDYNKELEMVGLKFDLKKN